MDMKRAAEVARGMLADAHAAYRSNNASWKDVKDQIALLDWLVDLTGSFFRLLRRSGSWAPETYWCSHFSLL